MSNPVLTAVARPYASSRTSTTGSSWETRGARRPRRAARRVRHAGRPGRDTLLTPFLPPLFTKLDPTLGETGPEWAPIQS